MIRSILIRRWPGVNCGTRQQSISGLRDPLTNACGDYVTVGWGLIIEDVCSIVKRIFSCDIIGTDLLIITSATGNAECKVARVSFSADGDSEKEKSVLSTKSSPSVCKKRLQNIVELFAAYSFLAQQLFCYCTRNDKLLMRRFILMAVCFLVHVLWY